MKSNKLTDFYFCTGNQVEVLTKEKLNDAIVKAKNQDNEAMEAIIKYMMPRVMKWCNRFDKREMDLDDLISVGVIAVMEAVKKYQFDMGAEFPTYAEYWIHKNMSAERNKTNRTTCFNKDIVSLNDSDDEEEDVSLADIIESNEAMPGENYENSFVSKQCMEILLEVLTPVELNYIILKYGFYGEPVTGQKLFDKLGVGKRRANDIERNAFAKLRSRDEFKIMFYGE